MVAATRPGPRRARQPRRLTAGAAMVVLAGALDSGRPASANDTLIGEWSGITSVKSQPQHVRLIVHSGEAEVPRGLTLRYANPRGCEVSATFVGTRKAAFEFKRTTSTCDHVKGLSPIVRLQLIGGAIEYRLVREGDESPREVGYLSRD